LSKPRLNRRVVEAGGDTDTIASMTGQIVGAWIGSSHIPKDQIQLLPNLIQINQITDELFKVNREML
jgi:ADP-ribosylglycohydrolase